MKLPFHHQSFARHFAVLRLTTWGSGLTFAMAISTWGWSQESAPGKTQETTAGKESDRIGSSATLEWLQTKPSQRQESMPQSPSSQTGANGIAATGSQDRICSLSAQPTPAFQYRFWPSRFDLRPGSAQTHFYRAILQRSFVSQGLPKEKSDELNQLLGLDMEEVPVEAAREFVERFESVFVELEAMAQSEDNSWDLRLRDLRGKDIWNFRLEDVQQARTLARFLQVKIAAQIAERDYAGATDSIRAGFRLAAFVGQGESIIQGLVGVAIENVMLSAVEFAIRSPECPNFYWALQTLPTPLVPLRDAVESELGMVFLMFPMLNESEATTLSDTELMQRLNRSIGDLRSLMSDNSTPIAGADSIGLILTLTGEDAKTKLKQSGYDSAKLEKLTPLQASMVNAGRELKVHSDELLKGIKVRGPEGDALRTKVLLDLERWASTRSGTAAGLIGGLIFPATQNVHEALVRIEMMRQRLIAVEALRAYAAAHSGRLPESLSELSDTPVGVDPFSSQPFEYRIKAKGDRQTVTLSSKVPQRFASLAEVKFEFPAVRQ